MAGAVENPVDYISPDTKTSIRNIGNTAKGDCYFQISDRRGNVLLSSNEHPLLGSGYFAGSILWSKDSRYVAFSVGSGRDLRDTYVFSVRSKTLVRISTEVWDYQTEPVRWHDAKTLIVQTDAPFGGKATEEKARSAYRFRRTIRLIEEPLRYETWYTGQPVYKHRD